MAAVWISVRDSPSFEACISDDGFADDLRSHIVLSIVLTAVVMAVMSCCSTSVVGPGLGMPLSSFAGWKESPRAVLRQSAAQLLHSRRELKAPCLRTGTMVVEGALIGIAGRSSVPSRVDPPQYPTLQLRSRVDDRIIILEVAVDGWKTTHGGLSSRPSAFS